MLSPDVERMRFEVDGRKWYFWPTVNAIGPIITELTFSQQHDLVSMGCDVLDSFPIFNMGKREHEKGGGTFRNLSFCVPVEDQAGLHSALLEARVPKIGIPGSPTNQASGEQATSSIIGQLARSSSRW